MPRTRCRRSPIQRPKLSCRAPSQPIARTFMVRDVLARLANRKGSRDGVMCGDWQRLDAVAVDEGAIPELEIEQRPERVAAGTSAGARLIEQPRDRRRPGEAPLARAAIEED